jgi:hypothetical protein
MGQFATPGTQHTDTTAATDRLGDIEQAARRQVKLVGEEIEHYAGELAEVVKRNPYLALGVATGLAFAVGALWKMSGTTRQSRLDALMAQFSELPSARQLRNYFR